MDKFPAPIHNEATLCGKPIFVITWSGADDHMWSVGNSDLVITSGSSIGRTCCDYSGYDCQMYDDVSEAYASFEDLFLYDLTEPERKDVMSEFEDIRVYDAILREERKLAARRT